MRVVLSWSLMSWLLATGTPVEAGREISAEILPAQVRPGDLFELRVEMDRADYARFELQVPAHERLHRVAVESVPVSFEDGRYRQSERWILQADSSGEIVIDGATVSLVSGAGTVPVELPPLRVEVSSYAQQDESAEPVVLPAAGQRSAADWWRGLPLTPVVIVLLLLLMAAWLGLSILLASLVAIWWRAKRKRAAEGDERRAQLALDAVLADLDAGEVPSSALERMMLENGDDWSDGLRQAVEAALYARRGEARQLAAMLRQEVTR